MMCHQVIDVVLARVTNHHRINVNLLVLMVPANISENHLRHNSAAVLLLCRCRHRIGRVLDRHLGDALHRVTYPNVGVVLKLELLGGLSQVTEGLWA